MKDVPHFFGCIGGGSSPKSRFWGTMRDKKSWTLNLRFNPMSSTLKASGSYFTRAQISLQVWSTFAWDQEARASFRALQSTLYVGFIRLGMFGRQHFSCSGYKELNLQQTVQQKTCVTQHDIFFISQHERFLLNLHYYDWRGGGSRNVLLRDAWGTFGYIGGEGVLKFHTFWGTSFTYGP